MENRELVREYHRIVRSYPQHPMLRRDLNSWADYFVGSLDFFKEDPRRIDCVLRREYKYVDEWDLGVLQYIFEERLAYGENTFKTLEVFLDLWGKS